MKDSGGHVPTASDVPAVLLDRDGVINVERASYVRRWSEFVFQPGALPALARLAGLGRPVLVITNQSVIGRGLASLAAVEDIHRRMCAEIERHGGRIDGVYLCPHQPGDRCGCRKPRAGMLLRAASEWRLSLERSVFVGDSLSDYEAAREAGCGSILVRSGRQGRRLDRWLDGDDCPIVDDLAEAVALLEPLAASA